MRKIVVFLLIGIMGMHLLPHATDHSKAGVLAGSECRANVCNKKQVIVKARKEEERLEFEETAMDSEQIAFDYGA
jgi:hypothetical protein